ncbi:hypothetical protein CN200_29130 [Sinorhizobium meliloti]|jgi:hypothetical protein|uniref:hypothetical protein n=1 Tax=Rhizobium meliloti TaxID=382 RepID=UPI000EFB4CCB|nr:hypothetical protein [Sinorhizobium meliloti]MCO5966087.1 hypothetical protein [Sinorhizobium meliloti]RMC64774.1 hypothetical protein EBB04_21625 [Sinorhizobium meliloti]RVG12577.1 hypothetical protein CN231_21285 [Sinorhizobium meliloti]RVH13940.1 hypothetical protein CN217_06825 [Sinorhizobium meliloti]RVH18105.1 hypothetical protein CN216_10495 [Sinorhizobium meliloti]
MTFYSEMQAMAAELIEEFGQAGVVRRLESPDPVYGGDPVVTSYPATLVPMAYEARYIDGSVILTGDMQIYISSVGLAIEPTVGDVVTANGKDYAIVAGDRNKYDGIAPVVFIVQGRMAA